MINVRIGNPFTVNDFAVHLAKKIEEKNGITFGEHRRRRLHASGLQVCSDGANIIQMNVS